MKDLNAGMALSETYIKASVTNRTNVLKRRQENTLDFMRTYGILLPLQKLHVLKKELRTVSAGPPLVSPPITQIPNHRAGFYKPHIYRAFLLT